MRRAAVCMVVVCFLASPMTTSTLCAQGVDSRLVTAVDARDIAAVRELLEKGANPDATDRSGRPVLILAAAAGHTDVVQALLAKGATPDRLAKFTGGSALFLAADRGHLDIVKLLLEKGASVSFRSRKGFTPLAVAAVGGHDSVVEALLNSAADPNIVDQTGQSALMHAAVNGQVKVARLLLAHKADPNAYDKESRCSLMFAVGGQFPDVVSLLIEHGADVNTRKFRGTTPLMMAADRENPEIIRLLLKAGADPNARDSKGLSASDIGSVARAIISGDDQPQDSKQVAKHSNTRFRLVNMTFASDSIRTHKTLWVAAMLANDGTSAGFTDTLASAVAERQVLRLPAGTQVTLTGKATGVVSQITFPNVAGTWWIPNTALTDAKIPLPPNDYSRWADEEDATQ